MLFISASAHIMRSMQSAYSCSVLLAKVNSSTFGQEPNRIVKQKEVIKVHTVGKCWKANSLTKHRAKSGVTSAGIVQRLFSVRDKHSGTVPVDIFCWKYFVINMIIAMAIDWWVNPFSVAFDTSHRYAQGTLQLPLRRRMSHMIHHTRARFYISRSTQVIPHLGGKVKGKY